MSNLGSLVAEALDLRSDLVGEEVLKRGLAWLFPHVEAICDEGLDEAARSNIRLWIENTSHINLSSADQRISGVNRLKTDFPVHALLLNIGVAENPSAKYLKLCAHVVLIAHRIRRAVEENVSETGNRSAVLRNRVEVCRRARLISQTELECLPDISDSAGTFYSRVKKCPQPDYYVKGFGGLCTILERSLAYSLAMRRSPFRSVSSKAPGLENKSPHEFWADTCDSLDPDDGYSDQEGFQIRSEAESSDLSAEELRRAGTVIEEVPSPTRLLIPERSIRVNEGESVADQPFRTRNAFRHVVKNQQMVPSRWPKLTPFELYLLISTFNDPEQGDAPTRVALMLSLMTGTVMELVVQARFYRSSSNIPEKPRAEDLCIVISESVWGRGVLRPEQAKSADAKWIGYFESTGSKLVFPIPDEFNAILGSDERSLLAGHVSSRKGLRFSRPPSELIASAKALLSSLNKKHKTRFTLLRVQQALHDALISNDGDRAEAALITGQMPATGQIASLYYHFAKTPELATIYKNALSSLPTPISFERSAHSDFRRTGVGSEICPKIEPLELLVKDLQAGVESASREGKDPKAWIDYHNRYVRYAVVMVFFATGHRAVQDPIPFSEDVDWQRGAVVINDKSGDHTQKDRLVPLVPECVQQLEYYTHHRKSVLNRLRVLQGKDVPSDLPFFFFLTESLKPHNVQKKTLQENLRDSFDLPLNINRHLLRSNLRKQGLPGSVVDACLGHWSEGQCPFDRFSTMDPTVYLHQCCEAINWVFSKMGWKAMRGLS